MIISSSISTASQPVRDLSENNRLPQSENVAIGVVATYSIAPSSKTEKKLFWGVEVTNDIAVSPSGESIVVRLVTDYTVQTPSTKKTVSYTQSSDYDITSLLGSVNISTPFTSPSDSDVYLRDDVITVTSQSISLISPASNPYTAGDQTWNFTL